MNEDWRVGPSYLLKGLYDELPEEGVLGEIIVCNGEIYTWMNSWISLGEPSDESEISSPKMTYNYPTHCTSCGAPMHSNICEYCGVEYH